MNCWWESGNSTVFVAVCQKRKRIEVIVHQRIFSRTKKKNNEFHYFVEQNLLIHNQMLQFIVFLKHYVF